MRKIILNTILLIIIGITLVFAQGVGHGGGTVPIITIDLMEQGVNYNITPSRLKFEFDGAPYAIQLREVEQEYAKFLVMTLNASEPDNILAYVIDDTFILVPGETRNIDINHDGAQDIFVQLNNITYNLNNIRGATFFIKRMNIPSAIVPEEKLYDLSNYPSFLTKDGHYLYSVVGDKSSSVNVVAQTYILSSLSGVIIKNRLASEITDLNQNIISIGNPCVNEISAKIMGNPKPCDKDFQRGKGYIKLYRNGDFFHLVVAGYTDLGTKKAAEILANYQNYQFQGNEYEFGFTGDQVPVKEEETKKENVTKPEIIGKEETQKIESKESQTTEIKDKDEQKILKEIVKVNETKQNQTEKSDNIINKFISWFLSLFKSKWFPKKHI